MKLGYKDIANFSKTRPKEARVVLIYGPDTGLVKERATELAKSWVPDIHDPFSVSVLMGSAIDDDQARLSDEANAGSLMGGDRLIWIREAGNGIAPALKDYLKSGVNPSALLIIEAGNLTPKDALRKICEESAAAVALPCYVEDERDLATLIRAELDKHALKIAPDAVQFLANVIKGDRMRARMEIEKLSLYCHGKGTVNLEDAKISAGEIGTASLDDLVYAMSGGNKALCLNSLQKLLAEEVDPIKILRSLQYHVQKLLQVRAEIDEGAHIDNAIKSLQPPLFFKQADQFKAHVNRHNHAHLRKILLQLGELEARTKKTGAKTETLLAQFLLKAAA